MALPIDVQNRFDLIEALCPCPGEDLTEFTCEDWKRHLPCINAKLGQLVGRAGTVVVIGAERHNVTEAIRALTALAAWIEEACCRQCEPFSELAVFDECDPCTW